MQLLRRTDRAISEAEAAALLARGEYGVLSTRGADGGPYGVPLSYCYVNGALYFHCAVTGRKLDHLAAEPRVSFCVVGHTELLPEQFATRYESVIVAGTAQEVFAEEKQMALEALVAKYSAAFRDDGHKYIASHGDKTRVFRIDVAELSGKARR